MVTARLAVGSVSTLALGALVLGSAPYWLNRGGRASHPSPWGVVSGLSAAQSSAARSGDEPAQLLKLAALKSGSAVESVSPAPVAAPAPAPEAAVAATPAPSMVDAASPASPSATVAAAVPPASVAEEPQQVASAEAAPAADVGQDTAAVKGDRVNINTAAPSTLDHLPGAGRIGRTIVSHRPYKSVKDLVSRRVLRMSDFQKIQSRISVD